ncbi:S9 family peptidase [Acidobacteria bacterium AB60]|nr:S9 family peptidase [Acidobacteria bacterium AB60]
MPLTDIVEEIVHGTVVRDPYRWLENRSLPETEAWIRAQQRRCDTYFDACQNLSAIERRVRDYLDVEVVDQPAQVRVREFYRKRTVGQDQGSIFVREIVSARERLLVDPSRDGKYVSVGIHRISPDGTLLAYEVRRGGEDRKEIRFVDVDAGTLLPNRISLGYGRGLAFSPHGYFYCHETEQSADEHRICYGAFGSVGQDAIVFRVPKTKGSRLVLIANEQRLGALWCRPDGQDIVTDFWISELGHGTAEWAHVFQETRVLYGPVLWHDRILVLSETASGSSQVIELSRDGEELGVVVPERETPIRQIALTRDRIFVGYLDRSLATIEIWMPGREHSGSLNMPQGGTIRMLPSPAQETEHLFYTFESFNVPQATYKVCSATNQSELWHQQEPVDQSSSGHVREITVRSFDGVEIPLTLVSAHINDNPNSPGPVIMNAYGGFGVPLTSQFSVLARILIELGAVLALAHVRGGGEFGKAWHDAGRARNRQASFDDFVAAAEWLCREGIASPRQLGIFGGSNSGLLVSAVMTQRPDLVGAVLCIAPLLDMVRYESFDQAAKWRREYGTVEDPGDFQALFAYSPYHHVSEDVNYPATLFVTGDKDDRCNPAHVRKMASRLQERPAQSSPIVVDYSEERGHSPVLPLSIRIPALARRIAFLCRELEIDIPDGGFDETTRC